MTNVRFLNFGSALIVSRTSAQRKNRFGLFRRLIEALHHSRRIQAMGEIRRHRHLLDRAYGDVPFQARKKEFD